MASTRVSNSRHQPDRRQYSVHSSDASSDDSNSEAGCSQFYRQTAKVRFTRTTSRVHQRMEAKVDDDHGHLFGCLRRVSSSRTMEYEERQQMKSSPVERGHREQETRRANDEKPYGDPHGLDKTTKRREQLEQTRQEVKRLDQLLEQKQRDEKMHGTSGTKEPTGLPPSTLGTSPDAWIALLTDESTSDDLATHPPSSLWNWCVTDQSSWPPHVDLEPFTGEPREWHSFIGRFKLFVHDAMPNDVFRMIYLEALLSPALKNKYASFFNRSGSYRELLVHLRNHHGSPYLVARSCFYALKQLASVDARDPKALAALASEVQEIVDTLRLAGCEADLRAHCSLVLTGVEDKLPDDLREEWSLYTVDRPCHFALTNLCDFSSWLNNKVDEAVRWWR